MLFSANYQAFAGNGHCNYNTLIVVVGWWSVRLSRLFWCWCFLHTRLDKAFLVIQSKSGLYRIAASAEPRSVTQRKRTTIGMVTVIVIGQVTKRAPPTCTDHPTIDIATESLAEF